MRGADDSNIPSVPDMLRKLGDIYAQRGAVYSDNYKHVGAAMLGLFPRGIVVQTAEEFNRLHFIFHLYGKLSRYCMNLKTGGHADSLDDMAVYAMMARECDETERRNKK